MITGERNYGIHIFNNGVGGYPFRVSADPF